MNSQLMVRLVSCTLDGIKNVLHGEVSMPHSLKGGDVYQDTAELLGIYGQNGSGKTSVVDKILRFPSPSVCPACSFVR